MYAVADIVDVPDTHIIQMNYQQGSCKPKVIIDREHNILGYLFFEIKSKVMFLEMIEIIEKEHGIGTQTIQFLFEKFELEEIRGTVLIEEGFRPYYFWESLGAEFDFDDYVESIEEAYAEGLNINFELKVT
ncbi:hypothetical protein [Bacillus sp. FJAT-29937]|uniref:hypothetical protein n=1 Tax=Bacillus sp. FJAT-29937 TaxID=1720553 RepID=UPI0008325622|nr:hypothetical protein [Bacillus sp. FJAT-29937]